MISFTGVGHEVKVGKISDVRFEANRPFNDGARAIFISTDSLVLLIVTSKIYRPKSIPTYFGLYGHKLQMET